MSFFGVFHTNNNIEDGKKQKLTICMTRLTPKSDTASYEEGKKKRKKKPEHVRSVCFVNIITLIYFVMKQNSTVLACKMTYQHLQVNGILVSRQ
jgi:hypothetical protein